MSESMYAWLPDAIAEKAEIVTASRRLARELRAAHDEQQIAAGQKAWPTPAIRSWQSWLGHQLTCVENPLTIPTRLDAVSSTWLMERCIRKQVPDGLPGIAGIVRQAAQSWQRLRDWAVPHDDVQASARSIDEQVFARAVADYARRLDDGRWIDNAGIARLVVDLFNSQQLIIPEKLVFAGFDRLVPSVQAMISELQNAGCMITMAPVQNTTARVSVLSFERMESEFRAAGAWARSRLEEKPGARIAIISPVLEANASNIARLVREGLVPGWQYGSAQYAAAVNVSYGRRLAEYPAITIALLLLRWMQQGLTSRELSLVLRSPCVSAQKLDARCRIELELRQQPDHAWSVEEFLRVFRGPDGSQDLAEFFDNVAAFAQIAESGDAKLSPADWAKNIDAALQTIHWPGSQTLDSSEFQLVNRWRELLNEFTRIEVVSARIDFAEACQRITALATETLFQPETGPGLVQLLGTLEAAGMEFDYVWISGLDSAQWPPVSRPALFISNELQRRFAMPDATPGDTLEFAQRVLARLAGSADQCVMSWSATRDDLELAASSLIAACPGTATSAATDPGWYAAVLAGSANFELCTDDEAPPVGSDEQVRGGAYTVQRQHVEPFAAFVYGRMGVRPPEPIMTGLSAGVRGNIIHNALHNLLAGKPDQKAMIEWTEESRAQQIGSAIDSALAEYSAQTDPVIRHIIGLERNRLRTLLQEFVAAESGRQPFAVVEVEKKIDYAAFGVRLGLRVDRIDRLANGSLLVIDYKTGLAKNFLGRSGEPADLQLVVYADALNADIGGLALINIDSRNINYKGAGGDGGPWKASKDDEWLDTLNTWRVIVQTAMRELAHGDVRINLMHSASDGRPLNILSRLEEHKRVD